MKTENRAVQSDRNLQPTRKKTVHAYVMKIHVLSVANSARVPGPLESRFVLLF